MCTYHKIDLDKNYMKIIVIVLNINVHDQRLLTCLCFSHIYTLAVSTYVMFPPMPVCTVPCSHVDSENLIWDSAKFFD